MTREITIGRILELSKNIDQVQMSVKSLHNPKNRQSADTIDVQFRLNKIGRMMLKIGLFCEDLLALKLGVGLK